MKNIYYTILISGAIMMIACSSPTQKIENAKTDLKDARQEKLDSAADFESFKKESEERIHNNEVTIAAFKARIASDKKHVKENDQKMIDELEQRNINMRKRIAEYKKDGKDEWSEFKVEFGHDMDELGTAIKNMTVQNTN